ncbi:MAG: MBL fold metallo-hydrolase RNA specificity domain-containing protein, partial [Nitrospinota bacterium]
IDCKIETFEDLKKNQTVDYVIDLKSGFDNISNLEILKLDDLLRKYALQGNSAPVNSGPGKAEIEILGANSSVTGSCTLVQANGRKILIDCGLYQGEKAMSFEMNGGFPFDPKEIDYLILTHAHLDHSGRIPHLIDQGFRGEILSHHASIDIYPHLLEDGFLVNPEFSFALEKEKLLEKVIDQSWGFEYGRWNQISRGISFRLLDAGHILGSATVQLNINGEYIVFSGDIGNKNTGIIRDPEIPDRADMLVMETTYGGRSHKEVDQGALFTSVVKKAIKNGGKVLIPAFAVGRTQEILYRVNDLVEKGEIQDIPVFVDTPLGSKIVEFYDKHKECFDPETLKRLSSQDDPLDFNKLFSVEKYSDSIALNEMEGAAIVIAGSGMCMGGRIINHLEALLEDRRTDVVFVGHQAENTLGFEILKFSKKESGYVTINGNRLEIKASVNQISGFSAHADHDGLLNWVKEIKEKPHSIYLNHGEAFGQNEFKKALNGEFPGISVTCALG